MLSYENQLLKCSTQLKLSTSTHQTISALLQQSLDWDEIVMAASWYAIKPLLYHCLRDNPGNQLVPLTVMQQLKRDYDNIVVRNMYIYATLARLLPRFKQHGIQCIVLKGAMLADTVYGDIGLRPMQDIDLLFNKEDLPAAISICSELGYLHEGSKSPQLYLDDHHHITYTHPDTDIPIELHWHIAHERHPRRLRLTDDILMEQWFERIQPVELAKIEAWTLCPTDLVFHLCLHFLKHRVPKNGALFATSAALLQLSDIVRTIYFYGDAIDWDNLRHQADSYQITDLVYTTLRIALDVCDDKDKNNKLLLNIPEGEHRYQRLIYRRLMLRDDMKRPIADGLLASISYDNIRIIIRAIVRWLLPDKKDLAKRYSVPETARRVYVYYLINPYHLIKTIFMFVVQIPRLSCEARLNRWIGGQELSD